MEWADMEALPDFEGGWPGDRLGTGDTAGLDVDAFNKDIRSTLIDKAAGDINTKIRSAKSKSGAYLYADIYKWFTETSGLGLAEQAIKLINPDPAKKEEGLAEALE